MSAMNAQGGFGALGRQDSAREFSARRAADRRANRNARSGKWGFGRLSTAQISADMPEWDDDEGVSET